VDQIEAGRMITFIMNAASSAKEAGHNAWLSADPAASLLNSSDEAVRKRETPAIICSPNKKEK
jgi:hypothetical protein